jgi:hypothetical protein
MRFKQTVRTPIQPQRFAGLASQTPKQERPPALVEQADIPRPSFLAAQVIEPVALQTTDTTIYTVPDDADFMVKHMWVCNTTGSAATFSVHLVPDAGSAATANEIYSSTSVAANSSAVISALKDQRLSSGMTIVASCSVNNAINIGGWGHDQTGEPDG